jgi:hypothetical protein
MSKKEMMNARVAQSSGVGVGWGRNANWKSCRGIRSGGTPGCISRTLS